VKEWHHDRNFLVPPTPHRRICGHRQRNDDVDLVSCLFFGDTPAARGLDRNGAVLPDIPTVGEFVPGYEASAWQGIGAPKNTPAEIIDRLNTEINAGLAAVLWGVAARHVAAGPPPTRGR
jgi:Tripartite tricarboxylate transporter family receptor